MKTLIFYLFLEWMNCSTVTLKPVFPDTEEARWCDTIDAAVPASWLFRPLVGMMKLQKVDYIEIEDIHGRDAKQLLYEVKDTRSIPSHNRCVLGSSLTRIYNGWPIDVTEDSCNCRAYRDGKYNCEEIQRFKELSLCHSEYQPSPDMCEILNEPNHGVLIPLACEGTLTMDVDLKEFPLDNLNYPVGKTVPVFLDMSTVENEGRTYYLAWKILQRFTAFSEGKLFCGGSDPFLHLENFTVLSYFDVQGQKTSDEITPFGVLARKGSLFLLLLRDSALNFDGFIVSQQEMVNSRYGMVHLGFNTLANVLNPRLENIFHKIYAVEWDPMFPDLPYPRLLVVGDGNLGGGVATIVSLRMSEFLGQIKYGADTKVDAIVFNGPKVGDSKFAANLRRNVNFRDIKSSHLIQFLCDVNPRCSAMDEFGNVETSDMYFDSGGIFKLNSLLDPHFAKYGVDSTYQTLKTTSSYGCQRVGALECWLAQFCKDDEAAMCKNHELCELAVEDVED